MRPRKRVGSADESHRFSSQASYGGLSFTLVFPFSSAIPRLRETPSTLSTEHEIQKCLDHVSHARHGKIRGLVSATTGGLHQGSFSSAPKGYILHSESQSQEIEHQNDHLVDTRRVSSHSTDQLLIFFQSVSIVSRQADRVSCSRNPSRRNNI
jgi:hypothetical protein